MEVGGSCLIWWHGSGAAIPSNQDAILTWYTSKETAPQTCDWSSKDPALSGAPGTDPPNLEGGQRNSFPELRPDSASFDCKSWFGF